MPNPALVGTMISFLCDSAATSAIATIQASPDLVIWTDVTSDTATPSFIKYTGANSFRNS